MEEPDDIRGVASESAPRWFAPESLRPIHQLNRRLLAILIDEARRPAAAPSVAALGGRLTSVADTVIDRLAAIPISLIDAGFQLDEPWRAVASGNRRHPEQSLVSPLPRGRALELAALTFGLASTTARASKESARLIFGMSPSVANTFATFSLDIVHWLGHARAHWIRPRWHDRPAVWMRLVETAEHAQAARLPPVSVRAMNRLLADLEAATGAASEIRRSRR